MMIMKQKKTLALLVSVGLVAGLGMGSQAVAADKRYANDASKGIVIDGYKGCVLTRGGVIPAEGCGIVLDSDGDGVTDDKDRCPGTPRGAPVDASGCPLDSDGDLVPDYKDHCPGTTKGVRVDGQGCEIKARKKKVEKVVIDNVMLFDFDSAELKGGATSALDSAYAKFKNNGNIAKVIVTGHTDSIGSDDYNVGLSERRANAVRDYLISAGANGSKLQAGGLGESRPTASNDTEAGRAANRRVEFNAVMK